MKVIQSFRSDAYKPLQGVAGGSAFLKGEMIKMALSCRLAQRYVGPVTMYTDAFGASLVVKAGIPYNDIVVHDYVTDDYVWIEPKLRAYMAQSTPFVHFDNDLFLYQRIDEQLRHPFVCAHTESFRWPYYERYQQQLSQLMPDLVPNLTDTHPDFRVPANAAVFGGSAVDDIAEAASVVLDVLAGPRMRAAALGNEDLVRGTMPFFEQLWLPVRLADRGIKAVPLLQERELYFKEPLNIKLTHLFGVKYQNQALVDEAMQYVMLRLLKTDEALLQRILSFSEVTEAL